MPLDKSSPKAVTYTSYLKVDELLDLQEPRSGDEHDEMLFIIIHQVYELWFKQILHEARLLDRVLAQNDLSKTLASLKRILTILKTLVGQIDILETMTPISFNSFRTRLDSASGFQSYQFRELEFMLGKKSRGMIEHHPEGSTGRSKLEALWDQPTIFDSFLRFLVANGYRVPDELLERDVTRPLEPSTELQDTLLEVYRNDPMASLVCELFVDLDEGLQEWRYRHVKMVERTIGGKPGTGGSDGAGYLRTTLSQPLFPDLWAVRNRL